MFFRKLVVIIGFKVELIFLKLQTSRIQGYGFSNSRVTEPASEGNTSRFSLGVLFISSPVWRGRRIPWGGGPTRRGDR